MTGKPALLVTGATGRLGSLLRLCWPTGVCGLAPVWFGRRDGPGVTPWQIGCTAPPALPAGSVLLHLAGELRGDAVWLAQNASLTTAVCEASLQAGVRHVFVASTAAVYRPGPEDRVETTPPDPGNPYGAAKLAAEQAAQAVLAARAAPGLTILRIGNVAGADALLGQTGAVTLDPVPGQPGGPIRSYIGPGQFATVLGGLIARVVARQPLPLILNLAQPGAVAMADLLTAAGRDWSFGPPNPRVIPRATLDTGRLAQLVAVLPATAGGIAADLSRMGGRWP